MEEVTGQASADEDLSLTQIERAIATVQAQHDKAVEDMKRLEARASALARELELLRKLLALRSGVAMGDTEPAGQCLPSAIPPGDESSLSDVVVHILEGQARPVHISELMQTLSHMGVEIPGKGTAANVISHLVRDSRVVRPSRGMYALRAWGLEDIPVKRRKKAGKRKTTTQRGPVTKQASGGQNG